MPSSRLAAALLALCLTPGLSAQETPTIDDLEGGFQPAPSFKPLNVLVIVGDDMGLETVGAYDAHPNPGRTPTLDALAERGVKFHNTWTSPTCSPTRANIITGRHGWRTHIGSVVDYGEFDFELSIHERSLPDAMQGIGYRTAAIGKWHLATQSGSGTQHPHLLGFERFLGSAENLPNGDPNNYFVWDKIEDGVEEVSTEYATTVLVDDTLEVIEDFGQDPWFVYLAFHAEHSPYHAPPRELHTYDLPPNPSDDWAIHAHAMGEAMDTEIGRLLETMDPLVLARTLIVFIGDNGTAPPAVIPPFEKEHSKASMYQGGIQVPLIVAGPGVAQGGESEALVHATDLFATIAELTGADAAPAVDSVSFAPVLIDPETPSPRTWVFAEKFRPNGLGPFANIGRTVRNQRFKLIKTSTDGVLNPPELYDLSVDPLELNDLMLGTLTPGQQNAYDQLDALLADVPLP